MGFLAPGFQGDLLAGAGLGRRIVAARLTIRGQIAEQRHHLQTDLLAPQQRPLFKRRRTADGEAGQKAAATKGLRCDLFCAIGCTASAIGNLPLKLSHIQPVVAGRIELDSMGCDQQKGRFCGVVAEGAAQAGEGVAQIAEGVAVGPIGP